MATSTTDDYKVEGGPASPVYVVNSAMPVSTGGGDTQLGAVELKNSSTDDRATVASDGRLATDANLQIANADVAAGNPVPTSVATGANVVEGALADAAIITDTTGTINGKLRGLVKWAFERMPTALVTPSVSGTAAVAGLPTASQALGFDGTSFFPMDAKANLTLLASASRTTDQFAAVNTFSAKGFILMVDITIIGTGSITPNIYFEQPVSVSGTIIWTAAAPLILNGTYLYHIYPSAASAALWKEVVNMSIPRRTGIKISANNANAVTYSVFALTLL